MSYKKWIVLSIVVCACNALFAQDMKPLIQKVKQKLETVKTYEADGKLKTNITFIKAPIGKVHVYYKAPNKFKITRTSGISILPKNGISFQLNTLLEDDDFIALLVGETNLSGTQVKIIKLLPVKENSDVILTTLYIDEKKLLIKKATTTTKENGTFDMEMTYGVFEQYALPDKVIFTFNTKEYKIPKGVTLEFDDAPKLTEAEKLKSKKGKVEIIYSGYLINKLIDDSIFAR